MSRQADIKAKRFLGIWWAKGNVEMHYRGHGPGHTDVIAMGVALSSRSALSAVKKRLPNNIKKREKNNAKWKRRREQKKARNKREETVYIGDNL